MKRIIEACITAFRAGAIATRCQTGCVMDDEKRRIIPCAIHADTIAELAARNAAAHNA